MNLVRTKIFGVLAMQGAYHKHSESLKKTGIRSIEVRTFEDINSSDALIIPGGESTTMAKLLAKNNLIAPLKERIQSGMPVFGTCAGMILLAKSVNGNQQPSIGVMDISVERNAYGRQIDSFEADLSINEISGDPFHAMFIRAPKIREISENIDVLASHEGVPVLVRQKNILAASFHPELTDNLRIHEYFIKELCCYH